LIGSPVWPGREKYRVAASARYGTATLATAPGILDPPSLMRFGTVVFGGPIRRGVAVAVGLGWIFASGVFGSITASRTGTGRLASVVWGDSVPCGPVRSGGELLGGFGAPRFAALACSSQSTGSMPCGPVYIVRELLGGFGAPLRGGSGWIFASGVFGHSVPCVRSGGELLGGFGAPLRGGSDSVPCVRSGGELLGGFGAPLRGGSGWIFASGVFGLITASRTGTGRLASVVWGCGAETDGRGRGCGHLPKINGTSSSRFRATVCGVF